MLELTQTLQKAASGDTLSIQNILIYFKEQKLTPDEQEKIHIYLKQAAKQSHYAIYLRALLYDNGYGIKQDHDMTFLLMREAAAKGNALAIYEVGHRFLEGIGVAKNHASALQWLTMAAGSPYYIADAMYDLGRIYEEGLSVTPDPVKARNWYEKAAQKGHI
jgi:TPR repeat protein